MYKIRYSDDSEFMGGDQSDSKWNEMPNKPIASLQYSFADVNISMKGFEQYNHIIEHVVVLNNDPRKIGKKVHRVSKAILMGKWKNRVYEVIFDFDKKNVYQQVEIFGKEYIEKDVSALGQRLRVGQATTGWKKGAFDPSMHPKIKRG